MKERKVPVRMCTACREGKPKRELMRIVKNKDGEVMLDKTGKAPGRGAYICASIECLERAMKIRALERALDTDISDETYAELRRAILRRDIEK